MLVSALLIFAMSEVGFQFGRRKGPSPDGGDPSTLLETTAFTLLALLLAFSFSLALGRYDARRGALLREANAISTTFLRADLLEARSAQAVRGDLRAYVAERLAFLRAEANLTQRQLADQNSTAIQRDIWKLAMQAANRDPHSTMVPLFIAALNDTINLSTEERVVLTTHIPDIVIVWLLLIAFIASAMMGYGFGRQGKRALIFKVIFAVMVALVFGLVLDLDRPQRGIIRINLAPMQLVEQSMGAAPSSRP
jgi:transcriptional regulator with XRE-family HTH domain